MKQINNIYKYINLALLVELYKTGLIKSKNFQLGEGPTELGNKINHIIKSNLNSLSKDISGYVNISFKKNSITITHNVNNNNLQRDIINGYIRNLNFTSSYCNFYKYNTRYSFNIYYDTLFYISHDVFDNIFDINIIINNTLSVINSIVIINKDIFEFIDKTMKKTFESYTLLDKFYYENVNQYRNNQILLNRLRNHIAGNNDWIGKFESIILTLNDMQGEIGNIIKILDTNGI